jgi:hypothetical protein
MDDWDGPVLIPYVKHVIHQLIADVGAEMYKKEAVRDWGKIAGSFEKRRGMWIPKHYEENQPH